MKVENPAIKSLVTAAVWLLIPAVGVAQSEPLSLKHGVYVEKQEPCKGAPNAAIMVWDGSGFSGAHSSHCTSHVVRRDKSHFQVSTDCSALGDGSPRAVGAGAIDSFLLIRQSDTGFAMVRDRQEQRNFRWCSVKDVD